MEHSNFTTFQLYNKKYLLVINGKPEGPYTVAELQTLKVGPNDFCKIAGNGRL